MKNPTTPNPAQFSTRVTFSPQGHLSLHVTDTGPKWLRDLSDTFSCSTGDGLLALAGLPPEGLNEQLVFFRSVARSFLHQICSTEERQLLSEDSVVSFGTSQAEKFAEKAAPMTGGEYLDAQAIEQLWREMLKRVRKECASAGFRQYLQRQLPEWSQVGRIFFHLAENKHDDNEPFAFIATYAAGLSSTGAMIQMPFQRAFRELSEAKDRSALLALLAPLQRASERSSLVKELIESWAIYTPLVFSVADAYRFLQDVPILEEAGIVLRIPGWAKAKLRPEVRVSVGGSKPSFMGADALVDFSVNVSLGQERLSESEIAELLDAGTGLVRLKGEWVEIDGEQLGKTLEHWREIQQRAARDGISFYEAMRLVSGASIGQTEADDERSAIWRWSNVEAGSWLGETLGRLRPNQGTNGVPHSVDAGLHGTLRPYQRQGVEWLQLLSRLQLGGCLADDMGLGKTIQVIALLLLLRKERGRGAGALLVVPASLIANWKSEIERFAPQLTCLIAHPSEAPRSDVQSLTPADLEKFDIVITTYGYLAKLECLKEVHWLLAVIDEAQAIKNAGAKQSREVRSLKARARFALTGTPIENRVEDLWSIFDFINPGLLGTMKQFQTYIKKLKQTEENSYAALRRLVEPYILRRLKTDKRVISDLPEKTELKVFCPLSKEQAATYKRLVEKLRHTLENVEGIKRRGIILSFLMQFKQICNHPAQWDGVGEFSAERSGKFQRLVEICTEIAARQEKALVFTQFREVIPAISATLKEVFGRAGVVLHGEVAVKKRREVVQQFESEDGPPFFVLSLKAGGTGLNLVSASHVIHFDRWWNPAVEEQATDRAFRIGQKKHVMVHKFVCRGTLEERIDEMICSKRAVAEEILGQGAEKILTEVSNEELLRIVALDLQKAVE